MYRVFLLGPFRLEDDQGKLIKLPYRNVSVLLAYLLLHKNEWLRREELAEELWPKNPRNQNNFRNALHGINKVLPPVDGQPSVQKRTGLVKWNADYPLWADVETFTQYIEESERLADEAQATYLCDAAELYGDEFLKGEDPIWIEPVRGHYKRIFKKALHDLVEFYKKEHLGTAILYAERLCIEDKYDEQSHHDLMLLHVQHSDTTSAKAVYEAFARVLEEDLDLTPSDPFTEDYEKIGLGVWPLPDDGREQPHRIVTPPFVNRDEERQHFLQLWEKIGSGEAQTLILSGEAGIGKSRLAQAYEQYAIEQRATVLRSRCDEQDRGFAYAPFIKALEQGVLGDLNWKAVAKTALAEVAALAPKLRDQASFPKVEPNPALDSPEQEVQRLLNALGECFAALAKDQAVVLFFDDIQWADAETLAALHHIIQGTGESRLLVLLTYREGDVSVKSNLWDILDELAAQRHPIHYQMLKPLEHQHIRQMINGMLGEAVTESGLEALADHVYAHAGGNAFFAESLVYFLHEQEALAHDGKRWKVLEDKLESLLVPDNVKDLVEKRRNSLTEEGRQLLSAASVLGGTLTPQLLEGVLGRWERDTLKALDEICWAQFLDGDDWEYEFHHQMIREVVYKALDTSHRLRLHRSAAQTYQSLLEADPDRDVEYLGDIAYHYDKAKRFDKALAYYLDAGKTVWAKRYAKAEAKRFYQRALDLALSEEDETSEMLAYRGLGEVCVFTSDFDEGLQHCDEALKRCTTDEDHAQIYFFIGNAYHQKLMLSEALENFEKALDILGPDNDSLLRIEILYHAGTDLNWMYEYEKAIEYLEEGLRLIEAYEDDKLKSLLLTALSDSYSSQFSFEKAVELSDKSTLIAEKSGNPYSLCASYFALALARYRAGYIREAIKDFHVSLNNAEKYQNPQHQCAIYNWLIYSYLRLEDIEKALKFAKKQLEYALQTNVDNAIARSYGMLGGILQEIHQKKQAISYLEKCKKIIGDNGHAYFSIILTFISLENFDQAFKWLKEGICSLEPRQKEFLKNFPSEAVHPNLDIFRKDQNFRKIMLNKKETAK